MAAVENNCSEGSKRGSIYIHFMRVEIRNREGKLCSGLNKSFFQVKGGGIGISPTLSRSPTSLNWGGWQGALVEQQQRTVFDLVETFRA